MAREWIAQAAEQVAEYRRTGYGVVLVDDGAWGDELAAAGLATLPALGDGESSSGEPRRERPARAGRRPTSSSRSFTTIVDQAPPP